MKNIDDLFSHILDEVGDDNFNNDYSTIFWKLWSEDIEMKLGKSNSAIVDANASNKKNYKILIRPVSRSEYLIFRALIICPTVHFQQGETLCLTTLATQNKKEKRIK